MGLTTAIDCIAEGAGDWDLLLGLVCSAPPVVFAGEKEIVIFHAPNGHDCAWHQARRLFGEVHQHSHNFTVFVYPLTRRMAL